MHAPTRMRAHSSLRPTIPAHTPTRAACMHIDVRMMKGEMCIEVCIETSVGGVVKVCCSRDSNQGLPV